MCSWAWIQQSWGSFGAELVQALTETAMRVGQRVQLQKRLFMGGGLFSASTASARGSETYPGKKKGIRRRQLNLLCFFFLDFMGFFLLCHDCGFLS